jgi:hypothetical protein
MHAWSVSLSVSVRERGARMSFAFLLCDVQQLEFVFQLVLTP